MSITLLILSLMP